MASLQHVLRWDMIVQTSVIHPHALFLVWYSSSALQVQAQDEHEMRTSSYLGQGSKHAYVMMRGTKVVNKEDG